MRMGFGISEFERTRGDLPEMPVINMFAESAPTEETGVVLQSRPGLSDYVTMGSGPVHAIFSADGVLDDGFYGVSGSHLYAGTFDCGAITGSGPWSMAGFSNLLFVAGGAGLWTWDMTTLVNVAFPDAANVRKVIIGASRAICIRADTQKFYWSDPLTSTINALSFATAESQPDRLRDMLFIDDTLILFGAETVEFWPNTGDADLPFQPLEGRVFERGIKATGCAVKVGATFAWVTNLNQICIGDPDNIITTAGLEALISATDTPKLWTFYIEGTEFLAIRIDAGTWVYSMRAKTWSKFNTDSTTNWAAQCHARGFYGSSTNGKVYRWASDNLDLGTTMERRFRAGIPLNSGGVTISNILLRTHTGQTPYTSGAYLEPTVQMRFSRDLGHTWSAWRSKSLGIQGDTAKRVKWNGCGIGSQPGFLAEFKVTAPIDWRVSEVLVNEKLGGRQ